MGNDRRIRSIAKTLTWRLLATAATICIVYMFTGKAPLSFEIGGVTLISHVVLYYCHERLWTKISWGVR